MTTERFFKFTNTKHNEGILLNEYDETYSLVKARKLNGAGTVYMDWCFPARNNKAIKKDDGTFLMLPMGVRLGNHREAIRILSQVLKELKNDYEPHDNPAPEGDPWR